MGSRKPPALQRRNELAAIHAGKKQLGLDDDTYRGLLESVTGQRSAADLDPVQRRAVLNRMRELGNSTTPRKKAGTYPGRPSNMNRKPMLDRIEQLLTAMSLPWSYADRLAQHMYRVDKVEWLKLGDQLQGVIAALDAEHHRRTLRADVTRLLEKLGMTEAQMVETLNLHASWRSKRVVLEHVVGALVDIAAEKGVEV